MNLPIVEERPEIEFAKAISLSNFISYQGGSVVSRMIINNENGSVTLFSFDRGQGLSEHVSPFDALVQLVDGEAEITISGKAMKLSVGEMLYLPAGHPHILKATTPFKMLLMIIHS